MSIISIDIENWTFLVTTLNICILVFLVNRSLKVVRFDGSEWKHGGYGLVGCSLVELIAEDVEMQKPRWFVSHAWLEPITLFVPWV